MTCKAVCLSAFLAFAIAGCVDKRQPTAPVKSLSSIARAVTPPQGASVTKQVVVPSGMTATPFDVPRYLTLPPNFSIAVYTRVAFARFLAVAPNGWLLVSVPSAGKIVLVRPNGTAAPLVSDFATGLRKPHDIVFETIGGTTYIYVAESHQINQYVYSPTALTGQGRQIIIAGLPDASTPGLGGAYGHELKNIAIDAGGKLYVSIASTCNVCVSDTQSNPVRGSIYVYNSDGTGGRLYARGLRNAEGLAFPPGSATLWVVVNHRDNVAYPFNDGTGNYGKVVPSYVDNHPPEQFTSVRDGGNYGWPFCNPNPDTPSGLNDMPYDIDYQMNSGGQTNCAAMDRAAKGIQAHSAPLGLTFLGNTNFPTTYRQGVVVALHGSWNRTVKTGYKLVYFPWDPATQLPAAEQDFVMGWLTGSTAWGRPMDMAVDPQGDMLISDNESGTIYKLTYTAPPPPTNQSPVANFTVNCVVRPDGIGADCTYNGTSSSDPDGSIARYDWTSTSRPPLSGALVTYPYKVGTQVTATLTVTDNAGATNTKTTTFTVGGAPPPPPPPTNQPPVANFTYQCVARPDGIGSDCHFNGSSSSDPDGTITAYHWQAPNRTPDPRGVTATYPFKRGSTATVTLTVTDNQGATGSKSVSFIVP